MQVYNSDFVKHEDSFILEYMVQELVLTCPSMPAQIVACCYHTDACIASISIALVKRLVACTATRQAMLAANVSEGIVRTLSHASKYCRSAACVFTDLAEDDPELLQQMLDAGIVPALIKVLGEGRYQEPEGQAEDAEKDDEANKMLAESESLSLGSFNIPVAQPAFCAAVGLVFLIQCKGTVVDQVGPNIPQSMPVPGVP